MYKFAGLVVALPVLVGGAVWYFMMTEPTAPVTDEVMCTQDVQLCEDGSYVSRVAPSCAFASCPGKKEETKTGVGVKSVWEKDGVRVTPLEILEDSRCPEDVMCVQAGTVRLKAQVGVGTETAKTTELSLGAAVALSDGRTLTLHNVLPPSYSTVFLQAEEYRFDFMLGTGEVDETP